jgi:hypothetical protein
VLQKVLIGVGHVGVKIDYIVFGWAVQARLSHIEIHFDFRHVFLTVLGLSKSCKFGGQVGIKVEN